jgi:hypothetical protein
MLLTFRRAGKEPSVTIEQGTGCAPVTGLESWTKSKISFLCRESNRESSGVLCATNYATICAVPDFLIILLQMKLSWHT